MRPKRFRFGEFHQVRHFLLGKIGCFNEAEAFPLRRGAFLDCLALFLTQLQ